MLDVYQKIGKVQQALKPVVKEINNAFFKSKYADINVWLAELRPLLFEHNLVVLQPIVIIDAKQAIKTIIINGDDTKQQAEFTCYLREGKNIQEDGSIITYMRRYTLKSIFLGEEEDDDGNKASLLVKDKSPIPVQETKYVKKPSASWKDFVMPLGKHKGEKLGDIPMEYKDWMVDQYKADKWQSREVITAIENMLSTSSIDNIMQEVSNNIQSG